MTLNYLDNSHVKPEMLTSNNNQKENNPIRKNIYAWKCKYDVESL